MTRVLVAGATGNVGARVIRELLDRGVAVRGYARDPRKVAGSPAGEVDTVVGDFAHREKLREAMTGADAVFLSCANDPRQFELETAVIDAALEAGIGRLVKLSALGARVGSPVEFWDVHARIESYLYDTGIPSVVLRPGFLMSNLLGSAETIKHVGQFFLPAGEAAVAMADPRDVAVAAATALTAQLRHAETFRLTAPEAVTFTDVAAQLSTVLGSTVKYVDVPDELARSVMTEAGTPDWLADNLVTLFGRIRAGDLDTVTDDYESLTGMCPRTIADFARDHAAAFTP